MRLPVTPVQFSSWVFFQSSSSGFQAAGQTGEQELENLVLKLSILKDFLSSIEKKVSEATSCQSPLLRPNLSRHMNGTVGTRLWLGPEVGSAVHSTSKPGWARPGSRTQGWGFQEGLRVAGFVAGAESILEVQNLIHQVCEMLPESRCCGCGQPHSARCRGGHLKAGARCVP